VVGIKYSIHVKKETANKILVSKCKSREHLEDFGTDRRIISKLSYRIGCESMDGLLLLMIRSNVVLCTV
jgi:hypothetical protein